MQKIRKIMVFADKADCEGILPKSAEHLYANPSHFQAVKPSADAVYAPKHEKIREAYRAAGKIVWEPEAGAKSVIADSTNDQPKSEAPQEPSETEASQESSEDWRELSWPKMRSLAAKHTDEPIKSKEQAKEVLEQAEVAGEL